MRLIKFVPLALLGACVAQGALPSGPAARVFYGDLALESRAGRAELRQRVAAAAQEFCQRHGDDVTPGELRLDASYCLRMLHASIIDEMPSEVRRSYWRSLRETGLRGGGL